MSISLKLTHEDGLRLRQQQANEVTRTEKVADKDIVIKSKEWKFVRFTDSDNKQVEDVPQEEDYRRVDNNGKKVKLGTYTVHLTSGMRNLVIERKGKVAPFNFKNTAVRNQIRVRYQTLEKTGRKTAGGKEVHEWKDSGQPQYYPPNQFLGVFVGDNQRAIVDEMPT